MPPESGAPVISAQCSQSPVQEQERSSLSHTGSHGQQPGLLQSLEIKAIQRTEERVMVAHTFNVGLRKQRQGDVFEFQASQGDMRDRC